MSRLILLFIILLFCFSSYAYTVMPAQKSLVITGYTRAVKTMTVTAETAGRLTEVRLGMGDVSDGGVFAVIDPVFTKYSIDSVDASIKKLDASIAKLENNIEYLKKEYGRVETLFMSEVETESRRDAAKQSLDQAELSLTGLKADRDALSVNKAELTEKLKRQYVKVPAGWRITSKPMEAGELVAAGQSIATAGDFRRLILPVFADNDEVKYLKSKDKFDLTVDGRPAKGFISRMNPAFDERTRKRELEITLDAEGIGGMTVEIPVTVPADGFMIHESTLNSRYANPKVTVKSSGKEVSVNVLGRSGDMVMIAATPELQPGMELEAVK